MAVFVAALARPTGERFEVMRVPSTPYGELTGDATNDYDPSRATVRARSVSADRRRSPPRDRIRRVMNTTTAVAPAESSPGRVGFELAGE